MISGEGFGHVEGPVIVEVLAGPKGSKLQDRLCSFQAPPSTGDIHAIFDEMAAGSFDDAGRDRKALREELIVTQQISIFQEIAGALSTALRASVVRPRRVALRRMPAATMLEFPFRIERALSLTHCSTCAVPSSWKQ